MASCEQGDPCPCPNLQPLFSEIAKAARLRRNFGFNPQPLKGATMPGIEAPIDPPNWAEGHYAPFIVDDGTMDTVVQCGECGEQLRFNPDIDIVASLDEMNTARLDEAFAMFEDDHHCDEGPPGKPDWNPENRQS